MEQTIITCMNCGNQYEGDYCPSCGQPASTGKFTWKSLLLSFLHAWDFESGFLYVFRELWLHPRQLIRGYLDGKRVNVYPPIKYMLISIAITTALHYFYKPEDLGMRQIMIDGVEHNIDMWTSTNLSIFHFLMLPFYALSTRLFFKNWKLTLPEHIVLNMFAFGQMNCLEFLVLVIFYWVPNIVVYSTLLSMVIPTYLYFMMSKPRTAGSLFKSIAASVTAMFTFLILIMILSFLYMVLSHGGLAVAPTAS